VDKLGIIIMKKILLFIIVAMIFEAIIFLTWIAHREALRNGGLYEKLEVKKTSQEEIIDLTNFIIKKGK